MYFMTNKDYIYLPMRIRFTTWVMLNGNKCTSSFCLHKHIIWSNLLRHWVINTDFDPPIRKCNARGKHWKLSDVNWINANISSESVIFYSSDENRLTSSKRCELISFIIVAVFLFIYLWITMVPSIDNRKVNYLQMGKYPTTNYNTVHSFLLKPNPFHINKV